MLQFEWGELIRKARLKRGWSQKGLAERVGITNTTLSRIECGNERRDASEAIARIVELLKIEETS